MSSAYYNFSINQSKRARALQRGHRKCPLGDTQQILDNYEHKYKDTPLPNIGWLFQFLDKQIV